MSILSVKCPYCQSASTRGNGKTSSGTQRYRCNDCKKSFTFTVVGRPCIGDRPLTNQEKVKRHHQKIKSQEIKKSDPAL